MVLHPKPKRIPYQLSSQRRDCLFWELCFRMELQLAYKWVGTRGELECTSCRAYRQLRFFSSPSTSYPFSFFHPTIMIAIRSAKAVGPKAPDRPRRLHHQDVQMKTGILYLERGGETQLGTNLWDAKDCHRPDVLITEKSTLALLGILRQYLYHPLFPPGVLLSVISTRLFCHPPEGWLIN